MASRVSVGGRVAVRCGFSLVELLVVIAIIALVISIVLPALGLVRTQAKIVATQTLTKTFSDAAGSFARDNDRVPGYYSVEEMGHPENAIRGMSAMENAILDLMGGVVIVGAGGVQASPTQVPFGPTAAIQSQNNSANRMVDIARIGVRDDDNPAYFQVDPKYLVAQEEGQQFGVAGHVPASTGDPSIPDVVDAFGTPLLLWVENSSALTRIESVEDFADIDSGNNGSNVARFYWASNAAFLKADQLGSERRNQRPGGSRHSIISDPTASPLTPASVRHALAAMLGSPAYPPDDLGNIQPNTDAFVPQQARGAYFIQSAGPDGYYLSSRDRGYSRLGGNMRYAWNLFVPGPGGQRHLNDQGQPTTVDVMSFFDDITAQGGI